jgi:hypothetical protein
MSVPLMPPAAAEGLALAAGLADGLRVVLGGALPGTGVGEVAAGAGGALAWPEGLSPQEITAVASAASHKSLVTDGH